MIVEPTPRLWMPRRGIRCVPAFGFGFSAGTKAFKSASGGDGFDLTSIAGGPTLWLDATDLTHTTTVSAINNKGSTVTDPTVSAAQPSYTGVNASYNGRPTWKCDAGLGAARNFEASASAHGMTSGPYTVVIVGQCGDSNYAMGAPSGGTLIAGGGGSGDKWQISCDAGTYLVSGSGLANNPSVMLAVFNGASSKIYVNSTTATTGSAGTTEDMSGSVLYIGNYGAPADALGANGSTTHFIVWNSALSQADAATVITELGAESGITIS